MLAPRIVLGAVVLLAMARFCVTPTWPCAFVVAVALVLAVASEAVVAWRRERFVAALADDVSGLKADVVGAAEARKDLSERIAALERGRALGGM